MQKIIYFISKNENRFIWALMLIFFFFLMYLAFRSEYCEGGKDAIMHYGFSKYCIHKPELFLDLWAKPIFMLSSFPFAQFGFQFLKLFNIICALLSSYLTYKIANKFDLRHSWIVIIFTIFSPIYFIVSISTLTEVLFSLILIYSIYLFINKNYLSSALLISLLPFARQEGYGYILLFAIALIINKKFQYLPYLLLGLFSFTLIGGFYYNDFLWLIHKHPYPIAGTYGSGPLFHFIDERDKIIGPVLSILFLIGIISWLTSFFYGIKKFFLEKSLFIFAGALLFLIAHSVCWWKGISGSLGLIRVMTCVIPLFSLICLFGWNFFCSIIKLKLIITPILIYTLYKIILSPFEFYKIPYSFNLSELVTIHTANWIKENKMDKRLICSTEPILWFFLNKNPFDNSTYREYFSSRNILYSNINNDAIIVWDSEYGKKQQGILLETLMQNTELKLLNINTPFASVGEKGVNTYVQYIFSKSKNAANSDNFRTEKNILGYNYTQMVKYSLKGFNQKYVSCDLGLNDSLICNRDFNGSWEGFGFIFEDTKKLKILCSNRKFLTSTYDSSGFYLISKSETIEDGLLFEMLKIDSNHITLKTNNNNFLSVDSLSQKLFISANYKNSCQIFELVPDK